MSKERNKDGKLSLVISGYARQYLKDADGTTLNEDVIDCIYNLFELKNKACTYGKWQRSHFSNGHGWQATNTYKLIISQKGAWTLTKDVDGDTMYSDNGYEEHYNWNGILSYSFKGVLGNYVKLNHKKWILFFNQNDSCTIQMDEQKILVDRDRVKSN